MKKLVLTLALSSCSFLVLAQVSDAWKNEIESIFQFVNRNEVTTGLLADYGLYFTNVDKYNGIPSDTNYIEYTEWQSLYTSLYSFRFNATAIMPVPKTVFEAIQTSAMQNTAIPLVGLHLAYDRFKPNAQLNGLVFVFNNKIYNNINNPISPYETSESFAIVPKRSVLKGASHQFLFKPEHFYTNTNKTIATVQANFADGLGYRTVTFNAPITVNYGTEGEKILKFKITYTDGTSLTSRTKIGVSEIGSNLRYAGLNTRTFDFPLAGFSAPKAHLGAVAGATVTVEYTNPERVIRKPLIIIEGFDAWKILTPDDTTSNFGFNNIIRGRTGGLDILIDFNRPGQTLSDALEENNYDLIFVDFNEGTDYIQRNAFLVANIIAWVNSVKQPFNGQMQQNVVLGFSMGGLVARYALRDMEVEGILHDTRLYASIDAPHQGANVPVGFQALVANLAGTGVSIGLPGIQYQPDAWLFGNMNSQLGRALNLINTPAAKQMLIYRVAGSGHNIRYNNTEHIAFMNEYTALGYPRLGGIRNIVLSNGSECGTNQGFEPYAEFLNVNEAEGLTDWGNVITFFFSPLTLLTNYPQAAIPFSTKTDIIQRFVVNALPNQTSQPIYYGRISIKKKILWAINVEVTLFSKSFNSNSSFLPIDNTAGGVYDIANIAPDLPFDLNIERFTFVPTYSSLDIGGGNQTITSSDVFRAYSPLIPPASPKNVIANNFFTNPTLGGNSNEIHTQITIQNGQWLFNEIQGTPAFYSCAGACPTIQTTVNGPSSVCTSNSTFQIANLIPNATISWTESSNLAYVSGQGTANYTVKAASATSNGAGWVQAAIIDDCGAVPLSRKNVWVGRPQDVLGIDDIAGPDCIITGQFAYYHGLPWPTTVPGADSYEASIQMGNPTGISMISSANRVEVKVLTAPWTPVGFRVMEIAPKNACGNGSATYAFFDVQNSPRNCGGSGGPQLSVSPNPADTYIDIELPNKNIKTNTQLSVFNGTEGRENVEITIFNDKNTPVYSKLMPSSKLQINTQNLPNGFYYLRVKSGEQVYSRQLVIKH